MSLCLTRKEGEVVRIGDEIEVFVAKINKHTVRLGFKAPPHVAIHRQEIYEQIQEELHQETRDGTKKQADTKIIVKEKKRWLA